MVAVCGALPSGVTKILNTRSKKYMDGGMTTEQARIQAATDIKQYLQGNTLGSSNKGNTQSAHPYTIDATLSGIVNSDTVLDVFNRLEGIDANNKLDSKSHKEHLTQVVTAIADKLNNILLRVYQSDTAPESYGEYTFTPKTRGVVIKSTKNPALNGLRLSLQEIAAHEFTHAVTEAGYRSGDYAIRKGIDTLYERAKAKLTPDSFADVIDGVPSTAAENKARYDYIFNTKDGVLEFIAFGQTNEKFRSLLQAIPAQEKASFPGIFNLREAVEYIFRKIISYLSSKAQHIGKDSLGAALDNLTYELAGLTKKQQNIISVLNYGLEASKKAGSKAITMVAEPIINKSTTAQAVVTIWKNWRGLSKFLKFGAVVGRAVNSIVKHKEYFFINLVLKLPQELLGMNETNVTWHNKLRKSKYVIDGARHKIKEATVVRIREAIGTMSDDDKRSITAAMVFTDLDDLGTYDSNMTFDEHRLILSDAKELDRRIKIEEDYLTKTYGLQGQGYVNQAKGLGMLMVRKETFNKANQMKNAHLIAMGKFDPNFVYNPKWKDAIPSIQRLKTLHALKYTSKHHKDAAVKFFDSQMQNTLPEDNGFNDILSANKEFKRLSLEQLFDNDPTQTTAGYTKDLNSPDVTIKFSANPADPELLDKGYTVNDYPLKAGGKNPNKKPMYMYIANHTGLVPFNKMTVSLTSQKVAGTTLADVYIAEGMDHYAAHILAAKDTQTIKSSITAADTYSSTPNDKDVGTMLPVTDSRGDIVGYRHIMREESRVKLLGKDNRIDNVMGAMFESITDKVESVKMNSEVAKELISEHKTLFAESPKGFITVTKNHPKFGEIYNLIPADMKAELDAHFGKGQLIVRESMMDVIFGYRKYSLFTNGDNSWLAQAMKSIVVGLLRVSPAKYYSKGRMVEQGIQELIQEIKTAIVLKTTVLGYNILSNFIVSFMHGMPLEYILKKQSEATMAVEDYINKQRQVLILTQKLNTIGLSAASKAEMEVKIARYTKDMENSPIRNLVDLGLLNSIVEDVTIDDTDFGIKGEISRYFAGKTKWVPKVAKDTYEVLQVTPKTGLYKLLEKTTRYSDFVARYAMHEWYLKEKGMGSTAEGRAEALKIVSETFINYDLPTSKELQYLNDMGAYMFTKYAVRVQKTLYRMMRDNPKSVVGLMVVESMAGNITEGFDSISLGIGGPSNPMGAMDEVTLPLAQAVGNVFNIL